MTNLNTLDEEFNNFMHQVNAVNRIVKKMTSEDKMLQEMATVEADEYLNDKTTTIIENIDQQEVELKVKCDRTLINKKAFIEKDQETMSADAFMESVSKDADQRYQDRKIRQEKCDTLKKQASLAFHRCEYEKALTLYNKALDNIKNSPALYLNRSLTYINLKLYNRAIEDAKTALKLNENSFKAQALLARAHLMAENSEQYENCIQEIREKHPHRVQFILDYLGNLQQSSSIKVDDIST